MYEELRGNLMAQATHFSVHDETSLLLLKAADAIEELQQYADLYKDLTEKSQKVATELKQQLQKSEEDNVNLTGWLAEEHAKQCPHYIRNVHDRGDDSLCNKWVCEVKSLPKWIPVTERLPEYDKVVQITDGVEVGHGYLEGIDTTIGVTSFWHSPFCDIDETHITHWMPLPQPPKDGES